MKIGRAYPLAAAVPMVVALLAGAGAAFGQASPPEQTTVTINGKKISIRYSAPSVRGRKIFGPGGLISHDPTYPVWRAGANDATAFHTDADLTIGSLHVPKGDYTLWVQPDPNQWILILNQQTGQWGLEYHKDRDLGRVPMQTTKPPKPIETLKIALSASGGNQGKLEIAWDNYDASVPFTVQ
ncbi:MAG TPA: DUF2911 domain-containing protein [Bryobacteraceae bacterium]|nr:DUF2911 domain-containing protein [Bryobacteraceae bacterium]